jgi:Tol biopolymer transport system component
MANARHPVAAVLLGLLLIACSATKNDAGSPAGTADDPHHLQINTSGLIERGGGRQRLLVPVAEGAYVNGVAVSPDNRRLAFVLQPPASVTPKGDVDFGTDLFVSNRDGRDRREVLRHSRNGEFFYAPFWLPDGEGLIYIVRGRDEIGLPDFRLEALDLRSGKRTRLVDHAVDAALASDGKSIAYVEYDPNSSAGERLMLTEIGSNAPARVIVPAENGLLLLGSPAFSPDGARIAFAASSGTARLPGRGNPRALAAGIHPTLQDLWLVNRDGTGLRLLAEIVESQPSVDWSPDGAFVYAMGGGAFWRVRVATGRVDKIGEGNPGGIIRLLKGA